MRVTKHLSTGLLVAIAALFAFSGCATRSVHHSSSVVKYLYPDKSGYTESAVIPTLSLPLQVGLAFVPEHTGRNFAFTEKEKTELLQKVGRHFKQHAFVESVEIIPSAYLTPGGSFANLDQIQTMYGVDVIVLVSYDQTQFTDEDFTSISYWTLIGAYIVPGEKNDTHTMVDAAVYDIRSRKMLFRAPGTSHIKGRSTLVNLSEELRDDSLKGFAMASQSLLSNLDEQLIQFKDKVKENPQRYQIVREVGYTGGGSLDGYMLFILLVLSGGGLWASMRKTQ